jgi:hypothetical protein
MKQLEQQYEITHQIKLIRRIIDFGYARAMEYADLGDDEIFTVNRINRSNEELLLEIELLKNHMYTPNYSSIQ